MDWTILGNKIKNFRKSNKITQQELANKLEISRSTLSYYELGKIDPNIYTLIKLADIMDCSLDYLVNDKVDITTNDFNIDLISTNNALNLLEEIQIYNKKILPILNNLSKIDINSLNYFLAEFNNKHNKNDFIKNKTNISNTKFDEESENVFYDEDFSMYEHKIAEDIDKYIP